jgi:hypothetical protein
MYRIFGKEAKAECESCSVREEPVKSKGDLPA